MFDKIGIEISVLDCSASRISLRQKELGHLMSFHFRSIKTSNLNTELKVVGESLLRD